MMKWIYISLVLFILMKKIDTNLVDMKHLYDSIPAHNEKDINSVSVECLMV